MILKKYFSSVSLYYIYVLSILYYIINFINQKLMKMEAFAPKPGYRILYRILLSQQL